jgi:hypothetical protein
VVSGNCPQEGKIGTRYFVVNTMVYDLQVKTWFELSPRLRRLYYRCAFLPIGTFSKINEYLIKG